MAVWKLNYTFSHEGIDYLADIIHYEYLTIDEIEKYKVTENTFLVHLFSMRGVTSFELYIGEGLGWRTSIEMDPGMIQILGLEIDTRSM